MKDVEFGKAASGFFFSLVMWHVASVGGPPLFGWFFFGLMFWMGWICLRRFDAAMPIQSNLDDQGRMAVEGYVHPTEDDDGR